MKSRSVSVTGASGFFGSHIAEAFARAGWRVRGIVRPGSARPLPDEVERREAPLETAGLARAIEGSDVVVHAAAMVRAISEHALLAVNSGGTQAMVDAANAAGSRLVLISSQAAAGAGTSAHPSREDDEPRPLTPYGRSKLAAETMVRTRARVPWTILRPCAIYGPRDRQFAPLFRLAARGHLPLAARADMTFTFVDVGDAASAVQLAAADQRAVGRTYFVGHAEAQTAAGLLDALAAAVGRKATVRRLPPALVGLAALGGEVAWRCGFVPLVDLARLAELRAPGFVCAVDRIRDELGFAAATPLREGLAETWRWYRAHGWP
ncbi:MAG: NAD(P)-dependent oxidoreductase [Acidobacteria bacterium]|nr:NAD(P)-dependent oxidoreductase [Acidobacteriota bacterium]